MSYFKAKMHQIRFRLGLRPTPRWGSLQRSPDPLAGFKGPTSKGWGRKGTGRREGMGREGRGEEDKGAGKGGRKGEGREKEIEGIGDGEGRGRKMGIAHPLFSA